MIPPSNRLLALGVLLTLPQIAPAAPPTITRIAPQGAQPGQVVDLVITGTGLSPQTRLLLPFAAAQELIPDPKPAPTQVRLRLTVKGDVPPGAYPIHVINEEGLSALRLFSVDAFPSVAEVEDNSTFAKAQKVTPPVIVDGQCAGGDVDFFRFPARKGQRLVLETVSARLGSAVLPQLRLTDAEQRFLAGDDSQSLHGDARLLFTAPADSDYVVELSDTRYRGGAPAHYRLILADYDTSDEVFPLGGRQGQPVKLTLRGGTHAHPLQWVGELPPRSDFIPLPQPRPGMALPRLARGEHPEIVVPDASTQPIKLDSLPVTVNARIDRPGRKDRFVLPVKSGERYRFAIDAERLGSKLDGVLRLTDSMGRQLALADDVLLPAVPGQQPVPSADPVLDFAIPAGINSVQIEVSDRTGRGGIGFGYRLTVEPATADFWVELPATEVNVPKGGSAALIVPIQRRGYDGPVALTIADLPPGLTIQGGHIPPGSTRGVLTVSAVENPASLPAPVFLAVEGKALLPDGKELRRQATSRLLVCRDAGASSASLLLNRVALALTNPEPLAVLAAAPPPAPLQVVLGYPLNVPVRISRAKTQSALAVTVSGLDPRSPAPNQPAPLPTTINFKPAAPAAGETAMLTLTPGLAVPEGIQDVIIQGKARVGPADRTVTGPALTLQVVRPFAVEMPPKPVELIAGQTVTVPLKLLRQAVCKEPIQVRLTGLPAGVTLAAPLQPLTADRGEVTIPLKVDAKANPGKATMTLNLTATIGGAAYNHPALSLEGEVRK